MKFKIPRDASVSDRTLTPVVRGSEGRSGPDGAAEEGLTSSAVALEPFKSF